jgi:RNA polymerase sigma-70 factor (ECF subfamily)
MAQPDSHRQKYEQWVRLYAPDLYRYAYRLTGKTQIAEDLVQETFFEAWRSIASQKGPSKARAWLFQILRYRHAHYLRDTLRHRQTTSLDQNEDNHPADAFRPPLEKLATEDALQLALDKLSPIIRETVLMVFVEGRTCRETAQSLRIPLGTVLSRLDNARRSLRVMLNDIRPIHRTAPAQKLGDIPPP